MKCPKCQFENPTDSSFCSKCGTQIISPEGISIPDTRTIQVPIKEFTIGSTLAGRYQIIEELGRGGMGRVYKVFDKEIKETIALKLLNPEIAADEMMIERFRNELKMARKISQKNICRMYHLGEEEGTYYITMEYVPGEDLKSLIRRIGQFTVGKAVSIAKQSYEGLAEAHKLGVVHRDLKPQNIMIDKEGNVRIMDFGIARFQESKGITDTGTLIGTPEYMSPEQVEGEEVDQRSDIYSSGVILYEMLTGSVPFEGNTPLSIAVKHKTDLPREPREFNAQIPDAFNKLILKCLEKKKEKRYQKAEDILSELTKIEKEIPTKEMILEGKKSIFWSFLRKLKERKIIETLAAFIGGGWLLMEFIIHLLIHEYKFPEITRDITLGIIIFSMVCTVGWQWFRGEEKRRRRVPIISRIKFKWVATLIITGLIIFGGVRLWRGVIQPRVNYGDFILLEVDVVESQKIQRNLMEYLLLRSLEASTESRILVQEDFTTYKRKTKSENVKPSKPLIVINVGVYSTETGFEDFDILVEMNNEGKKFVQRFRCKGPYDLISNKINEIHSFIAEKSNEKIGIIKGDRTFSQICTEKWDALGHFLNAEKARKKLEPDTAITEYRTALEYDSEFSLAYLKIAYVQLFRGDRKDAEKNLRIAWEKRDKLIEYDLNELYALKARMEFKPIEEREYRRPLVEAFPLMKECHYELAESYFHTADADEAIKYYSKALELDPNYSLAHNHIAFCYAWIGNHKKAEDHFNKYVELDNTANSYDSSASGYMFAGRYDEAIKTLNKGKELDLSLDWLYGNLARNFILKGALSKAAENLKEQISITKRENAKIDARFYSAFIEFLRGNLENSIQQIREVKKYYSSREYDTRVDESPNMPIWFTGVIAYEQKDIRTLREMTELMRLRFSKHNEITGDEVNATNYFPILKFYIHLKILEAYLEENESEVLRYIDEGQRIRKKMGYWSSMFHMPYFLNTYAEVLIKLDRTDQALELLKEAIGYNPNYASSHINMAKIHLNNNNFEESRKEYQKAHELLSDADRDFILVKAVEKIEEKLGVKSLLLTK